MRITSHSHAALRIDAAGLLSIENSWDVVSDAAGTDVAALLDEARLWAGAVGDPFRLPSDDGSGFLWSENLFVTAIAFLPVNRGLCRVTFTGAGHASAEAVGETVEKRSAEGVLTRSRKWRTFRGDAALLPEPGQLLDWEGGAFVCESNERRESADGTIDCTVTAREISALQLGGISATEEHDGIRRRSVKWFVGSGNREEFLAAHPLLSPAEWAGNSFYLDSRTVTAGGRTGFEITLTAREISTRLLEAVRREEFHSFARLGSVRRQIIWNARYQVHADDIATFRLLTGSAPTDWSEENCIITRITPKRRSDIEYEVEIEAQHRSNPGLFENYSASDRSSLGSREDVSVDMTEFHVSAEMAGYHMAADGSYQEIPAWEAGESCPFATSSPLDRNMIESTLRTLVITVTTYRSGGADSALSDLAGWIEGRVYSGSVCGRSGSYLKVRQTCSETCDDSGKLYTRINRSYQLAPGNFRWNSTSWDNH